MEVPKRKKPLASRGHLLYLLVGLLLFFVPIVYINVEGEGTLFAYLLCSPIWVGGMVLSGTAFYSFFSKESDLNRFRRSATSSNGTIIKRYIIRKAYNPEEPPSELHMVVFQFRARLDTSETKQYMLEAQITENLYARLTPDSEILVHYAAEDPRIAYLEGEEIDSVLQ